MQQTALSPERRAKRREKVGEFLKAIPDTHRVAKNVEWISLAAAVEEGMVGGTLREYDNQGGLFAVSGATQGNDPRRGAYYETPITGAQIELQEAPHIFFRVTGEHFSCGVSTLCGESDMEQNENGVPTIIIRGYGNHTWTLRMSDEQRQAVALAEVAEIADKMVVIAGSEEPILIRLSRHDALGLGPILAVRHVQEMAECHFNAEGDKWRPTYRLAKKVYDQLAPHLQPEDCAPPYDVDADEAGAEAAIADFANSHRRHMAAKLLLSLEPRAERRSTWPEETYLKVPGKHCCDDMDCLPRQFVGIVERAAQHIEDAGRELHTALAMHLDMGHAMLGTEHECHVATPFRRTIGKLLQIRTILAEWAEYQHKMDAAILEAGDDDDKARPLVQAVARDMWEKQRVWIEEDFGAPIPGPQRLGRVVELDGPGSTPPEVMARSVDIAKAIAEQLGVPLANVTLNTLDGSLTGESLGRDVAEMMREADRGPAPCPDGPGQDEQPTV